MKNKLLYSLIAGAVVMTGLSSCDNEEFLNVTHYSILEMSTMYESDANAKAALNGCYDLMLPSNTAGHNGDPFKPYLFTGSHPTMDSQATGWDKAFMTQSWNAQTTELSAGWNQAYAAITRSNDFLSGLGTADKVSDDVKRSLEGEARALRAYQYFWLATTFGRVPMLSTGENYTNTPTKARAETYAEMWDFIIEDLKAAAELLDWEPMDGQYGRCTKGMALAYLGDAYMWKAYRCPETANECYGLAKTALKEILDSGTYELNPSFTTLWDADEVWGKEAIWQAVLNEGDQWGGWDGAKWSEAHGWVGFYFGAPANGAWGTYAVSWELYDAYENGDKRRDGSLVTATIPESKLKEIGKEHWKQSFKPEAWLASPDNAKYIGKGYAKTKIEKDENGKDVETLDCDIKYDPDCPIGFNPFAQEVVWVNTFHREPAEPAPTVYSTKHWRNGRGTHWSGDQWLPDHIYMKRLPNVMLDYAECCFRTGEEAEGWKQINILRNRAFGNMEVGKSSELTAKFNSYFRNLASVYGDNGYGKYVATEGYPIPFNETPMTVVDAQNYYAQLKTEKGFTSDLWKVAVNEERRKEFNAEWCLRGDMQKSGYLEDHIEHNYPKGFGYLKGFEAIFEFRTYRDFDFNINKMDMPIPADELIKNPACDQNEAYLGGH